MFAAEPDKFDPKWPVSFLAAYGTIPYNDLRLLVEPEVGSLPPLRQSHNNMPRQISTFVQFRALDYGMENCSLALSIPEYGSDAMEIVPTGSTINM